MQNKHKKANKNRSSHKEAMKSKEKGGKANTQKQQLEIVGDIIKKQ